MVSVTKLSRHVRACLDQKSQERESLESQHRVTQKILRKLDAESTSKFATLLGGRYYAQILIFVIRKHCATVLR